MALLVGTIALSGLSIYGASILMYARHSQEMAYTETRREAALISGVVEAVLGEHLGRIEAMAVIGGAPSRNPESMAALIEAVFRDAGYIHSVRLLDADGQVWLTMPYEPSYSGVDLSGLPLVQEAMHGETGVWSSIYAGLDEGNRVLSMAVPSGTGLLLVDLDFEGFAERLHSTMVLDDMNLALTDAGGTYIVHPDKARVDRRETENLLLRERLSAPGLDSYEYLRHENGESWIVRAERIPGIGWYTIVQRPADFAQSAFVSSVALVSILTLVAVGAASGFAVFATRRLLEDVKVAGEYAESAGTSGFMPSPDSLYFKETRAIHDGISAALQLLREKDADNERLESLNRRLTQALDELSRAQSALVESEKLALLGRLSATVAHDLNTPIGAASASAQTAVEHATKLLREAVGLQDIHGPKGAEAVAAITKAVGGFNPASPLLGPDRRKAIKQAEARFMDSSHLQAYELASRLVDIGMDDAAGFDAVNAALILGGPEARGVDRALIQAEMIVAARIVVNATEAASSVVAALRAYVKGGLASDPESIALEEEFRSILALLGTRLRQAVNVRLETTGNPCVYGHRESLDRVWMNLVLNALEAMAYKGTLTIRIHQHGNSALVEIEDDGPGIPEGLLAEIWRPFFTTKADSQGTGLGLSIVRDILETEGGSIEVQSRPGHTVFTVDLPLYPGFSTGAQLEIPLGERTGERTGEQPGRIHG
jgi:C4-dicarboxylate-specific signal transduction histidine kinase